MQCWTDSGSYVSVVVIKLAKKRKQKCEKKKGVRGGLKAWWLKNLSFVIFL